MKKERLISIRIGDLKTDERLLDLRPVNPYIVSKYRQAMRIGCQFPPLRITDDNVIVCGNHRLASYIEEFGPEREAQAIVIAATGWGDILADFASDNASHGFPLDGFSRRRVACELDKAGKTLEEIAAIFNVPPRRVELWGNEVVIVRGKCGEPSEAMPAKHGAPTRATISATNYRTHQKRDLGFPLSSLAEQIIRWLEKYKWNRKEDEGETCILSRLKSALSEAGY